MTKVHLLLLVAAMSFSSLLWASSIAPPTDTILQNFHRSDKVSATKTESLIRLLVTDFRKNPLNDVPLWIHNRQGQFWQGTTDASGEVFFLLPNHTDYQVNVDQEIDYRKFSIPKEKDYFKTVKVVLMSTTINEKEINDTIYQAVSAGLMPTRSRVLVNLNIKNLEGQPLEDELLYFNAQKTKKVYRAMTDARGSSVLLLPKGDTYCIHTYAFRDITCKTYADTEHSRTSRFELQMIPTAEFKQREIERAILLAKRDSLQHLRRIQDSIQLARNEFKNFYLQHRYRDRDDAEIETKIKHLAQLDQQAVIANENHYAEVGDEIKAMFQRNKENWPQKRIIANIDCSMYQYIDELMVWNFSDPAEQNQNRYWLFNGFNYVDEQRDAQSRRGIFPVLENNVNGFFSVIDQIVNFSCRGSRLENVVEALILGAEGKTPQEDLLFIADNYSDVSDLEKLKELTVPVHVLLTDAEYGINENYLEIAHHSGGSVHTGQVDISAEKLNALKDGDQLTIGAFRYRFFKGKFLKV